MSKPAFVKNTTCPGCGETVLTSGLAKHRRTQTCEARSAISAFKKRGWEEMGYGGVEEAKDLGIPIERARTRRTGNSFRGMVWWPWWTRAVLNNWPGAEGARGEEALLRAFIRRLQLSPETARAYQVVWDTWVESGRPVTAENTVDFARAACGSQDADAEVTSALDALHRALLRRERVLG